MRGKTKLKRSMHHYIVVLALVICRLSNLYQSQAQNTKSNQFLVSFDQYLNASENSSDQNIYYDIKKTISVSQFQKLNLDMNFNWSQNENYLYTHVENFYYSVNGLDKNLNFGIKKLAWSSNLDHFNSPEWQQQLERNKLHPRTGGNLGVFYGMQTHSFALDLMYSPFFIPTRGPDVQFKNGQAITKNPWFLTPPTEVPYNDDTFSTRYDLEDPSLSEFLREPSFAIKALAFDGTKWSLNVGYANKPSPRLVTDLDFQANISNPSVPIDVFIRPRVTRHQLLSADLSYNFTDYSRLTFGYMDERIERDSYNSESETFMRPLDQSVFSVVYAIERPNYALSIGGIWRDGGRSESIGELASALVNQNINYLYEQAIKFDFTYFKTWGWTINTSISYDFLQKGLLTSATLQRTIQKALLNIGFDAIEPINATDQASFIYQYRNLDRVWAGVSYVF